MKLIAKRPNKKIYRDGAVLVKVFNHKLVSKADVLTEAVVQARIEETGLDMPHVLQVTNSESNDWAIHINFIEGETLQEMMDKDREHKGIYISKLVELQTMVHTKNCAKLPRMKEKLNARISESGLDATTRYELHMRLESMPRHMKLCHGDFNPSNIILGKDGKYYILDWAHATQGNASCDAAITYLEFLLAGDKDGAEMYISEFCKVTDTARQYVQKWIPIAAAAQAAKGKPEEKDFLLKLIDVVEYE